MHLRSVTNHLAFGRAKAWVWLRQGPAPSGWLPQGLTRLDDSWFAEHPTGGPRRPPGAAFEALPAAQAARARVACGHDPAGRSRLPPTLCEACARWCWSDLVELPPQTQDEVALLDQALAAVADDDLPRALPQLSAHTVQNAVSLAGLTDLGGLLARAPDRAAATVCGRLPAAWQARVWQARATGERPGRAALTHLSALTRTGDPSEVLFSLGAGRFASLLTPHPLSLQQTAQLLPVPLARHLLGATPGTGSPDPAPLASALREATAQPDTSQL